MKRIFLVLFGLISQIAFSQSGIGCESNTSSLPCCNGLIHTGPDVGKAINLEWSAFTNGFDWRTDDYDVYHPLGGYDDGSGGPIQMPNPFKTTSSWLEHINYYTIPVPQRNPTILDYKPEDGWELLHRHLGYKPDEVTTATALENRKGPYFILYNKYSGLFRVIAALDANSAQTVITQLSLPQPRFDDKTSGIFGYYGNDAQTLDENSNSLITRSSIYPGKTSWFIADFTLAYDPCVCNNDAQLKIDFKTVTSATVDMDGRLIATSVPLNGSGTSPLLNGEDYLLSLNQDGLDVQGGMQTYHNIDSLVAKFEAPAGLTNIQKEGLKLLGTTLKKGLTQGLDPVTNGVVSALGTAFFNSLDPTLLQRYTKKDSLDVGLGLGASLSEFFMGMITPEKPAIPSVSFIEGELKLTGTVTTAILNNSFEINLEQPGSKSSQYQSSTPASDWVRYPAYNEALGVIGVLEKPEIYSYDAEETYFRNTYSDEIRRNHFELKNFKYTFNPAAEVDTNKTFLRAALVGKFKSEEDQIGNFYKVPDVDNGDSNIYITDFYPLECLHGFIDDLAYQDEINAQLSITYGKIRAFVVGSQSIPPNPQYLVDFVEDSLNLYYPALTAEDFYNNNIFVSEEVFGVTAYNYFAVPIVKSHRLDNDLRLRIMIDYTFLENQYGKVNKETQTITFKTSKVNGNPASGTIYPYNLIGNDFPKQLLIDDNYVFSSNLIQVWNRVVIKGNNINWPTNYITIIAPDIVATDPSIIDPDEIELINKTLLPSACRFTPIGQIPRNDVKAYCLSSTYLADDPKFKNDPTTNNNQNNFEKKIPNFSLYPNPTKGNTKLVYTVKEQDENVMISVSDMFGKQIGNKFSKKQEVGMYSYEIDMSMYSAGVYFVTLQIGEVQKTQKLVLTK